MLFPLLINAIQRIENPMTALNPAKFVREVRQEMKRVTWPTRKETIVSTVTVLGVVVITSILFLVVDMFASSIIRMIIGV